jgi:hypothetical protein
MSVGAWFRNHARAGCFNVAVSTGSFRRPLWDAAKMALVAAGRMAGSAMTTASSR